MKVLLIQPPVIHRLDISIPAFLDRDTGTFPNLSLLAIAGAVEAWTGHEIRLLDCPAEGIDGAGLVAVLDSWCPDVIGLSVLTFNLLDVIAAIHQIRSVRAGIRVVLGGIHVFLYPRETLAVTGADFLIVGEGERAFVQLLDTMNQPHLWPGIAGLGFRDRDRVVVNPPAPPMPDLDESPMPARHLGPWSRYVSVLSSGLFTTMMTSRGCPYHCVFCERPQIGGKTFRPRSPVKIVTEMRMCRELGIRDIFFYDDTFCANRPRVLEICRLLEEQQLGLSWSIRTRVDTVDAEVLSRLRRAGCRAIHFGVEAGSPAVLQRLRKKIDPAQAKRAFARAKAAGLETLAYFMFGNPGETRDDLACTRDLIRDLRPDFLHLAVFSPYPGTDIYAEALASGIIPRDVYADFARAPGPEFIPPHWPEFFRLDELQALVTDEYRSFYGRPGYLLKRMTSLRSWLGLRSGLPLVGRLLTGSGGQA